MSSFNLLNIDVDKLFEQHNINEIAQIQQKLQSEVETKREELRMMVGERYRDLLKAADTIYQMKDTSSSIVDQMSNVTGNCKNLNEMQLIGFKTTRDHLQNDKTKSSLFADDEVVKPNKQLTTFYSTAVQTKIITILHEIIWDHLDDKKYFLATQFFILARHIHTGLQLDNENSFILYFPVGETHWKIMESFNTKIQNYIINELEQENITSELTTDCLLSLYLLNKSTLNDILKIFLQCRCKAFLNSLSNNSDDIKQRRVKDRILASLKVLNSTIDLVAKCFFNGEIENIDSAETYTASGLIQLELKKYFSKDTLPIISMVPIDDPLMLSTIPDIISKFKPTFEEPILTTDNIKLASENWLKSIDEIINNQFKILIELISSMKTIQNLKKELISMSTISKWSEKCQQFHLSGNLDFYRDKYQILINERVQDIIKQSWQKCITKIYDKINEMLTLTTLKQYNKNNENDDEYLWLENLNDIPISLKQALNQQKINNINKLLMKMKGYSNEIVEVCIEFDNLLNDIFIEMNVLLDETDNGKIENKQLLLEFLRNTSQHHTIELITNIKSLDYNKQYNCIVIAKLLLAFIDLCPNFKLCLSYTPPPTSPKSIKATATIDWQHQNINDHSPNNDNNNKWIRVCHLLEDESFILWKKFCNLYFKEFLSNVMNLNKEMGHKIILEDFVNWETISIEEKDEHENPIISTIRIPSQPRITLQQFLFKFIKHLTQKCPQTLPQKVLNYLTIILIEYFLQYYEILVSNEFTKTNQNLSIQLYFDLKFLQLIFLEPNNLDDRKNMEILQKLTNTLKNYIDPFDFELIYTHLCINIKNYSQRIYQEFGLLIPNLENLTTILLGEQKKNSTKIITTLDKDPNVLTLSSCGANSIWFPLLPVVMTAESKMIETKISATMEIEKNSTIKTKQTVVTEQKLLNTQQTTAQTVKSGAAAFFGAMGQDWFR